MKKALKIFWTVIVVVAALLFAIWLLIQMPAVQTFVAKKVTATLEENMDGRIEFSKIHLKPFNALVIKDFRLIDENPPTTPSGEVLDTLASAGTLTATFSLKGLFKKEGLHLRRVALGNGSFTFVTEPDGSNIKRFFKTQPKDKPENKEMGNIFDAKKVQIEGFRFRLVNLRHPRPSVEGGINWTDMDLTVQALDARDLKLADGFMKGTVERLEVNEKSGYHIASLSGDVSVGGGRTLIEDLRLKDDWSDISMDEFSMSYDNIKSFNDFLNDVRLRGDIRQSVIDFKSISFFAPSLKRMDERFYISKADVDGPVSDLGIDWIEFTEYGSGVSGTADGRITGLPDINTTVLGFNVENLSFTSQGLGKFISGFAPSAKLDLSKYAPGEKALFNGRVDGTLDDLKVKGSADIGQMGGLTADLKLNNLIKHGASRVFAGNVRTDRLDLGKALGIKRIGELTMKSSLKASLGKNGVTVDIDSLQIDKLRALDYDYSNIMAVGTYSDKAFDGRLVCNDPNLNLLFQGIFTLSDKTSNGLYKFYANVGYADLQALGLDKRGVSKVAGRIDANYMRVSGGDLIGNLDVMDLDLENSMGRYDVGDIKVSSHSRDGFNRINLGSSFADASYIGSKPITQIAKDLRQLTLLKELPVLCRDTVKTWDGDRYEVRLNVHDARDVLSFVMPGLYIADSTKALVTVSNTGDVIASIKSSRIAMGRNYLKNINFAFDNKGGSLNGALTSSEAAISGFLFNDDKISLYANDNRTGIGYSFKNDDELADKGDIHLSADLSRSPSGDLLIDGKTLPSSLWLNKQEWKISSGGFSLAGKDFKVNNLLAACGNQSLRVDGGYSTTHNDTLSVDLIKCDMGIANILLGKDYRISGLATGQATLTSPWKDNPGLSMSIKCDSVKVSGKDAGQVALTCGMEDDGRLNIAANSLLGGKRTFDIKGGYHLKDKMLDLKADLDDMETSYFSPLLASVFSEIGGKVSGKVTVSGKTNDLSVSSEDTRFNDVLLRVAYTNVPYYADGPFKLDNSGLHLDGIAVRDRFDGTGTISGGILFNHMKDFRMDTRISMNRMEAINMDESLGEAVYGNIFASGEVSIKGPFNAIMLDVNARTDKSGRLHIPIDNTSSDANTNLLTFKQPYKEVYIDPYDVMMNRLVSESRKESDFGIHLKVVANSRTEAYVEIDRAAGNVLNGRGQGTIDINVRPSNGLFTINGDYTLSSGNFHFNAMDIAKKDFTISQGSSIRFNGDVMDSDLDIEGIYTTKASIATLIADTSSVSTRRVVNCGIGISGKLREPQLKFSIDVPDVDPTTKAKVESALNTEDKVQRQFLALLISGGFMPEEQSGIVNNTTTLYSNLADIMAGQLNSILQKLDIPLDFGLNYQSSESGTNIFDVAVSTQLFNSRVLVNGNVGNREYGNSSSRGEIVGDFDIEVKLDKPGEVRLKLFSHSADDYTNFLDNLQRNGIGVTYQKEFNTFKGLIRSIFTSRKRRQERASSPPTQRELKSISINPE